MHQCLPWNFRGWHAGGDANNTHVGVEMTEPDCIKYTGGSSFTCSDLVKAQAQVKGTYETAVKLFAQLCTQYGLDPMTAIISHKEGHSKGLASNHGDPEHLWNGLKMGYTMDTFRKAVKAAMNGGSSATDTAQPETPVEMYRVRKSWADSKSQVGAYKVLNNAKVKADETGLNVYDSSGKCVYNPAGYADGTPFMVRVTILISVRGRVIRLTPPSVIVRSVLIRSSRLRSPRVIPGAVLRVGPVGSLSNMLCASEGLCNEFSLKPIK